MEEATRDTCIGRVGKLDVKKDSTNRIRSYSTICRQRLAADYCEYP